MRLRRALLRKTKPDTEINTPVGGIVAYWRWTARSGKKRGGYKLARLLGRDPNGKEDVAALRDASDNLQQNILEEGTLPEPPDDDYVHEPVPEILVLNGNLSTRRQDEGQERLQPSGELRHVNYYHLRQANLKHYRISNHFNHNSNLKHYQHRAVTESADIGDPLPAPSDENLKPAYHHDDGVIQAPPGWDGSNEIYMPNNPNRAFLAYQQEKTYVGTGESEDEEPACEDLRDGTPGYLNETFLTRQEQKALDREIPWRDIVDKGGKYLEAFVKAAQEEEKSWMSWNSVREVEPELARKIMGDPRMSKRIIKSRAAYRDKNKSQGELKAKCRVVAIGCCDPDLRQLALLSIYASGANQKFMGQKERWILWSGDVKTAFLQGVQEGRHQPLLLLPPQDGITARASTFRGLLYEIKGNVYGLANAPRTWAREVTRRLLNSGFIRHSLDHMVFYKFGTLKGQKLRKLLCIVLVYVDDFLLTANELYDREEVLGLFSWGSQTLAKLNESFTFKGKEITTIETKDGICVKLNQRKFIETITYGKISKQRLQGPPELTPEEIAEHRSKSTIQDLQTLYDTADFLHRSKDDGIVIVGLKLDETSIIVSFADSSWANAEGHASQHGALTLVCEPSITEHIGLGTMLDWKSSRSTRVCRSTLAAEASAADMSVDRSSYMNLALSELMQDTPSFRVSTPLRMIQITDCKSLYDCIAAENPNTEDKRTIVTIRSTQQYINRDNIYWVPTKLQWADSLTKISRVLMEQFTEWLQRPAPRAIDFHLQRKTRCSAPWMETLRIERHMPK
ncbi:unnamed protein product [Effrenium voratum]|uniref:Reverse transcriptase Ty1/copia-type domain-containing protein n=1 Tax=Effrenium voratum TaxID=2562239 RepID=A0AA36J333_9DINO|nr:unnamed protein product [Effrenium voratum]